MSDFFTGLVAGAVLLAAALAFIPKSIVYEYHAAIDKCEAQLPRDVECVMTAIPEVSEDG